VVPSGSLQHRLKWLLCVEQQLALLDVHVLTFHQLALHLYHEQQALRGAHEGHLRLELVQDLFFEQLVSRIARRGLPGLAGLELSNLPPGAWPALWATVRDLKDATVDPVVALRGIGEGLFEPEEARKLQALFTLYAAAQEAGRALNVGSVDDLASDAIPWAGSSGFLSRIRRICYYGFYDLTQVQLSLFESVAACAPVTLYFPLDEGPAFEFARRFFERHLHGMTPSSEPVLHASSSDPAATRRPREQAQEWIMNAVGPDDELTLVCKEILTLVETNHYRFDEIGIVARTLEPYHAVLRRTFDQHRIPFLSTAASPILQEPAAKVLLQLARLPITGFYRAPVLDVLTSPFYRVERDETAGIEPRPDLWQLAVSSLGITSGEEEWRRLASAGQIETWVGEGEEPDDERIEGAGRIQVGTAQLRVLWRLVSRLIRDCRALPAQGSMADLTEAFLALAAEHLAIPGLVSDASEEEDGSNRLAALGSAIRSVFLQLRQLERLGDTVSWDEWARTFAQAIELARMPVEAFPHRGVQVLDAMAARGLPFRALFLLGLNEKVFPRFIHEDAFLRDRHRQVLDATLGYKIDEKLTGYDEERLLFALLRQSARQRLYLLYQRADVNGRPLAASAYLDEFQGAGAARSRETELCLPRRLSDRLNLPLFAPPLLTREESALGQILRGHDPSSVLEAAGREAGLFRHGVDALRVMEGELHALGPYDGLVGRLDRYWEALAARGLAPTPLEQYARCPFQYFSAQVLRLEPVRQETMDELPAQALGEMCHAVLRSCYQRLVATGWPQRELQPAAVHGHVKAAAEETFTTFAAGHGTGYALTWQLAQDRVLKLVAAAVEADRQDFLASGFHPVWFEVETEGTLERRPSGTLKVRGRLDRVDRRETPPAFRVVDYKYRQGREMKSQDRDLFVSAIRGFRLQPPLYALMAIPNGEQAGSGAASESAQPEQVEFVFLAPNWGQVVDRTQFKASAWRDAAGRQLAQTVHTLVEGVEAGRYFILPDGYCDYCEFAAACRRFHGPTWWRAHSSGPAKQLRQLRKQKVSQK
ncbi:MAG: PD-(D/E)XK nuclease family protein, partial [Nitrospiraceae bacterium]